VKKTKSEIAKVSDQLEALANQESSNNQCNCQGHMKTLQNSILDLQCRSMKNNLIFTGLYEVRDENTEELLCRFGGLLSPLFLGVDQTLCGCSGVSKSPASSISSAGTYNSCSIYSRSRISATLLPCRFASF
jgi:hypothetical protein